jgi:hypothetical protein
VNNEFNILLKLHRRSLSELERKRPIKSPLWLYPLALEKTYAKSLSTVMSGYINKIMPTLEMRIEKWILQSRRNFKVDSWEQDYKEFIKDIENLIALYFADTGALESSLTSLVEQQADNVLIQSIKQWEKQVEAVLGDGYASVPPDWAEIRQLWIEENKKAIIDLAREYNKKLNTTIVTGLAAGWIYDAFAEQIQALNDKMVKGRVTLIARGSVGTLVGSIAMNYASSVGSDEYIWRTAMDERVRGNPTGKYPKAIPSHWVMEGLICKWSNSAVYSDDGGKTWKKRTAIMPFLPPGFEYNCFSGDTLVNSFLPTEILYRRRFIGRMIALETSDGITIRCTPNHPILRSDGIMVAADILENGDNIVHVPKELMFDTKANEYDRQSSFSEVFDFFEMMLGKEFGIPTGKDFHGDSSVHDDIDIIPIQRELADGIMPKIDKHLLEQILAKAHVCLAFIPSDARFISHFIAMGFTDYRYVGVLSKIATLFLCESGHSDDVRLRTASELYSIFKEPCGNSVSGDTVFFGECKYAGPVDIFINNLFYRKFMSTCSVFGENTRVPILGDNTNNLLHRNSSGSADFLKSIASNNTTVKIIKKSAIIMDTHVYNLQSPIGIYTVSRSPVIVNNCRCTASIYWGGLIEKIEGGL